MPTRPAITTALVWFQDVLDKDIRLYGIWFAEQAVLILEPGSRFGHTGIQIPDYLAKKIRKART